MRTKVAVPLTGRAYEILIGEELFAGAAKDWLRALVAERSCLVVADSNTAPLYGTALAALLAEAGAASAPIWTFPAGETSKQLEQVANLYAAAVAAGLDRKSLIVALGGGVCGDLAGFAAATYMRGIAFLQVPTSLLAQVDSSVGGKTGVDLPTGKNLVGAFHQPRGVLIDLATLRSLPPRQLRCGLAEVVKYGVILDAEFFAFLEQRGAALLKPEAGDYARIVQRACELKAQVVLADELDLAGIRAVLNYGHTFGHALETLAGYEGFTHGEAVAIGMGMAADLAQALEPTPARAEVIRRQDALLTAIGLPVRCRGYEADAVLEAMKRDKKFEGGRNRLLLPDRLGCVKLVRDVPLGASRQAIGGRCDPA